MAELENKEETNFILSWANIECPGWLKLIPSRFIQETERLSMVFRTTENYMNDEFLVILSSSLPTDAS